MMRKKVCLLGSPGVGKTSLVRRFVESMFSDDYLSTIGVKVDRKTVSVGGHDLTLLVWDIHGEHGSLKVLPQYLSGSAAFLAVVDASRPEETVAVARTIIDRSQASLGELPYVVALNKSDLVDDWTSVDVAVEELVGRASHVVRTSAKTGAHVADAFEQLALSSLA